MSAYMEKRFMDLHRSASQRSLIEGLLASSLAFLVVLFIPFAHLGLFYNFWAQNKPQVDPFTCSCSCFDTIFRGRYEWPPSTYKHLYFNTTSGTFKIFAVIVLGIILCYETVRHLVGLLRSNRCRASFLLLLLTSVYPHYYGLWNFFQYINEAFYDQWNHQLFFSLTELLSSLVIVHLCDSANCLKVWKLLVVAGVAVVHILVACTDQLVRNVFQRNGQNFEVMRDLGLTLPDVAQLCSCVWFLRSLWKQEHRLQKDEVMLWVLGVLLMTVVAKTL